MEIMVGARSDETVHSRFPEFQAALSGVSGLDAGSRRKAAAYLDGFFEEAASPEKVSRLLKTCVG